MGEQFKTGTVRKMGQITRGEQKVLNSNITSLRPVLVMYGVRCTKLIFFHFVHVHRTKIEVVWLVMYMEKIFILYTYMYMHDKNLYMYVYKILKRTKYCHACTCACTHSLNKFCTCTCTCTCTDVSLAVQNFSLPLTYNFQNSTTHVGVKTPSPRLVHRHNSVVTRPLLLMQQFAPQKYKKAPVRSSCLCSCFFY